MIKETLFYPRVKTIKLFGEIIKIHRISCSGKRIGNERAKILLQRKYYLPNLYQRTDGKQAKLKLCFDCHKLPVLLSARLANCVGLEQIFSPQNDKR